MSSTIDAIYSAASGLNAFGNGMNVTAHNIANVETAGFQPQSANYATGSQGQGVELQVMPPPVLEGNSTAVQAAIETFVPPETLNPSNTDISHEFVNMIATQRAYEANATTIKAWDEMQGVAVDLKV